MSSGIWNTVVHIWPHYRPRTLGPYNLHIKCILRYNCYPLLSPFYAILELKLSYFDAVVSKLNFLIWNFQAAQNIKELLDLKYGPTWHVIVGEGFSFEITYEVRPLLTFLLLSLLIRSGPVWPFVKYVPSWPVFKYLPMWAVVKYLPVCLVCV